MENWVNFEDDFSQLFNEVPEERENDIFAGEIWGNSPYSKINQPGSNNVRDDEMNAQDSDNNVSIFEDDDIIDADNNDEKINISQPEGTIPVTQTIPIYELKLMYTKVLGATIIVLIFSILALILALIRNFYTWRGISFNLIVILSCILGIKSGIYTDDKSLQHKIAKLKLLLVYWIILCICVIIIFAIFISYAIIMPIRHHDNPKYSTLTIVSSTIAYVFGILFWFIFVAFYVDLVARACLKRGRIEYVIMRVTSGGDVLDKSNIWFKMYRLVINYRFSWRRMRQSFTTFTGIRCLFDKDKSISDKEHEEQRVINMLQEGTNIDKESLQLKCKQMECECDCCANINICYCILYPFICCYKGVLKCGVLCMQCCGGYLVNIYECGSLSVAGCCVAICGGICTLFGLWVGLPLLLWILISALPISCCVWMAMQIDDDGYVVFMALACGCFIGMLVFFPLWFKVICPVPYDLSTENWNWDEQCNMWSYVLYFAVQIMAALMGGNTTDY